MLTPLCDAQRSLIPPAAGLEASSTQDKGRVKPTRSQRRVHRKYMLTVGASHNVSTAPTVSDSSSSLHCFRFRCSCRRIFLRFRSIDTWETLLRQMQVRQRQQRTKESAITWPRRWSRGTRPAVRHPGKRRRGLLLPRRQTSRWTRSRSTEMSVSLLRIRSPQAGPAAWAGASQRANQPVRLWAAFGASTT
jgi:hypothetical protein